LFAIIMFPIDKTMLSHTVENAYIYLSEKQNDIDLEKFSETGRTGRAGHKGKAITFFTQQDTVNLRRYLLFYFDSRTYQ